MDNIYFKYRMDKVISVNLVQTMNTAQNAQRLLSELLDLLRKAQNTANNAQGTSQEAQGMLEEAQGIQRHAQGMSEQAQYIFENAKTMLGKIQNVPQKAQSMSQEARGMSEEAQSMSQEAQGISEEAQSMSQEAQRMLKGAQLIQGYAEDMLIRTRGMLPQAPQDTSVAPSSNSGVQPVNPCSTNGLTLKCDRGISGEVTFTFVEESNRTTVLQFKLDKIYSEDNIYMYGLNNIMKIIEINKCIEKCDIRISFEQYYNVEDDWSNVFNFVLSSNSSKEEFNAVVSINDCIVVEKLESMEGYKQFEPVVFDNKSDVSQSNGSPSKSPNEVTSLDIIESYISPLVDDNNPNKIGNLSTVVNNILGDPNHNLNNMPIKKYIPNVKSIFQHLVEGLKSMNISIRQQVEKKQEQKPNEQTEIENQTNKAKAINDQVDITHDTRVNLQERREAINSLDPLIALSSNENIAESLTSQHSLLKAAEKNKSKFHEHMVNNGYILEQIPTPIQHTKNQVFTEFIARVVIKAVNGSVQHGISPTSIRNSFEPFVYDESGRAVNFQNFQNFYNSEVKNNEEEKKNFYSNLYDYIYNESSIRDTNLINKLIDDILNCKEDLTTIRRNKIQHIDACDRGGRSDSPRENELLPGTIPRVFGCLDVTTKWVGPDPNTKKNMYKVNVSKSIDPKNVLMTCSVTEEIPLKNVIVELQKLGVDVKDTRTKSDSDDCENSSSATLHVESFNGGDKNIQILCIDSLKTMCDKLYQLSEGVEYINTVDDMVPFDSCINYYGGNKESCPTVVRSFANGFYVTGGTRTTNNYSEIFYRNFVLLCFFCNSGYPNIYELLQTSLSRVLREQQPPLLPQIKSRRLINYMERLNSLQKEFCLNEERKSQLDAYDQWMIQIICCELRDKHEKIQNYIDNVRTILLKKYVKNNKNFDEFYRSIIGLEDLEKLLTMSSFSFYSSNEDSIFKPDRINIPERNCNEYGIQGSWTNRNIEVNKIEGVSETIINNVFNSIDNVEYDKDNTVIIFNENNKILRDNLNKLTIMIHENDKENNTNNIGTRTIKLKYAPRKVTTLTTPTTLELLFTLLKNVKNNSEVIQPSKKTRAPQDSKVNEQDVKENIKNKIIDITSDFMNQIGIECDGLSVEYLETLLVSSENSSSRFNLDIDDETEANSYARKHNLDNKSNSYSSMELEVNQFDAKKSDEPLIYGKIQNIVTKNKRGTNTSRSFEEGNFNTTPKKALYTGKSPQKSRTDEPQLEQKRVSEEQNAMINDERVNEEETAMMIDENRITNDMKKISNKGKQTRKKKGGRKPKFTRRKNKNSSKRKTIKKRKMPKRKNKTRRNK